MKVLDKWDLELSLGVEGVEVRATVTEELQEDEEMGEQQIIGGNPAAQEGVVELQVQIEGHQ